MIDLKTIIVDIRSYVASDEYGFPDELREAREQQKLPEFINACQNLVVHGWNEASEKEPALEFLKGFFKGSPFKSFFTRLFLLKLIYEETLVDPNFVNDKNWFRETREKLNTEFSNLRTTHPTQKIMIGDKEVRTLADLAEVRHQARAAIQQRNNFRPIMYGVGGLYFLARVSDTRIVAVCLSIFVIAASAYYLHLQGTFVNASGTLFQARRAEQRLQQQNTNIMDNADIKKFFLLDNDELAKVENPAPKPN